MICKRIVCLSVTSFLNKPKLMCLPIADRLSLLGKLTFKNLAISNSPV